MKMRISLIKYTTLKIEASPAWQQQSSEWKFSNLFSDFRQSFIKNQIRNLNQKKEN